MEPTVKQNAFDGGRVSLCFCLCLCVFFFFSMCDVNSYSLCLSLHAASKYTFMTGAPPRAVSSTCWGICAKLRKGEIVGPGG